MKPMYDELPFVYETYDTTTTATTTPIATPTATPTATTKMYNRGPIMSNDERSMIHEWSTNLMANSLLHNLPNGRLEYKIDKIKNDPNVLGLVFEIRKRIEQREDLYSFEKETKIEDFVEIILANGFIHKHRDPNIWERGLFHVRFNVFISIPRMGGTTYYDGHIVDAVEGSYVMCRSGIDEHWSDPTQDTIPRISLSFGYVLPPEKVDDLCKDATVGTYTQYYPLTLNAPTMPIVIEERGEPDLGTNVFTISDVFTYKQCDEIVNYIQKNSALWGERDLGYDSGNNVECKFLTLKELVDHGIHGAKEIDDTIFKRIGAVLNAFRAFRPEFKGVHDDGYTLRKIYGGTKRHIDGVHSKAGGFTKFVRALSLIIVLNDDYDGGIFNFPAQNLKFKVKKGEAVLFPPYWTHPHSVTSVGEGQARYTINTWILEKFID